jgi:hypothetical protein
MEAILNTAKPIVQELVENELKTLIGQNINEIDGLEAKIDTKLGEVAGKIKSLIIDNINKIPFVPDSVKKGFIDQIPVGQLVTIINGFDLEKFKTTILAIPTTGISDPTKLNQIRTTLTELPDKIKKMLTTHIESIFNGVAAAPGVPSVVAPGAPAVPGAPAAPGAPAVPGGPAVPGAPAVVAPGAPSVAPAVGPVPANRIKIMFDKLSSNEQNQIITDIKKLLVDIGIYNRITASTMAGGEKPITNEDGTPVIDEPNTNEVSTPSVVGGDETPVVETPVVGGDEPVVETPVVGGDETKTNEVSTSAVVVKPNTNEVSTPVVGGDETPTTNEVITPSVVAGGDSTAKIIHGQRRKTKKNIKYNRDF